MSTQEIIEGNKLITEFMDHDKEYIEDTETYGDYHTSWDWLHPVYRKIAEIGLWMMTNGHDKLWLEKSKEIEYAMLHEETPEKAARYISWLIKWYNQTPK